MNLEFGVEVWGYLEREEPVSVTIIALSSSAFGKFIKLQIQ